MKIYDQLKSQLNTTEQKHAFIDLACLLLFADNKSALTEQQRIENLIALETHTSEMLEKRYLTTMAKVKKNGFKIDAFIDDVAHQLGSNEMKRLALSFIKEFVLSDGASSDSELALLEKIKIKFAA